MIRGLRTAGAELVRLDDLPTELLP
jgi:hypothetical protein